MILQVLRFAIVRSMRYRILLICVLNSLSQASRSRWISFLMGVIMLFPTYPLSPSQLRGSTVSRTPDSFRQWLSCRLPATGSEIQARRPARVQATCTLIPVVLCFPEYSSGLDVHDQHGSRVPSTMYCMLGSSSSAVGT